MSGTIHVNTELLRDLGRRFQLNSQFAQEKLIDELRSLTAQTEGDWVGVSRIHYEELFAHWCQSAQSLIVWGQEIGLHLDKTAQYFETADQS
jgi:WXG100 family type VII secretion target